MEIKRKAELSLVAVFAGVLPDLTFYPSKGGTDAGGASLPKPPFGAIWIQDADKTMATENTYLLSGTVVWVSRAEAKVGGDVAEHSEIVRLIYDAMNQIRPYVDADHNLVVHGIDIVNVNEFSDTERQAHGDTISFVMGASETD